MENVSKNERQPRRSRINGKRNILRVVNRDPRFEYRVVNDVDDGARIAEFQSAGWEIVTSNDVQVGEKRVDKAVEVREGTPAKVSVGQGQKAYLMRIKKEWYAEDQAAKQADIDEKERALQPEGTYGKIDLDRPQARSKFT